MSQLLVWPVTVVENLLEKDEDWVAGCPLLGPPLGTIVLVPIQLKPNAARCNYC